MTVVGRSIGGSLPRVAHGLPPHRILSTGVQSAAMTEGAAPPAPADAGDRDARAALAERYWQAVQAGDHAPEALLGRLDLDAALTAQLRVLRSRLEAGERLGGFKG